MSQLLTNIDRIDIRLYIFSLTFEETHVTKKT